MPAVVDVEKCDGCHTCESECPSDAIAIVENLAVVKPDDCIDCNACENALGGGAHYRFTFPLHVKYSGSQLAFAVSYLAARAGGHAPVASARRASALVTGLLARRLR